jgi:hypothetical protein
LPFPNHEHPVRAAEERIAIATSPIRTAERFREWWPGIY